MNQTKIVKDWAKIESVKNLRRGGYWVVVVTSVPFVANVAFDDMAFDDMNIMKIVKDGAKIDSV